MFPTVELVGREAANKTAPPGAANTEARPRSDALPKRETEP